MAATQIFLFQSPVERWSGFIRLVLEEKDLDYDAQTINSLTGEQYEPGYVEDLNEKAALPTLVHKNKVVISWNYIARYLEKICKEPPLIPADAAEQSDMDKWLERAEKVADPLVVKQDGSKARLWAARQQVLHNLEAIDGYAATHPGLQTTYAAHTHALEDILATLGDKTACDQAVEDIEGALDELDGALKQRSHVAGAEYSLADAAWTAVLHELEMAGRDALWEAGKRRNVARWYRRMKGRVSYENAYGGHPVTLNLLLPYWTMLLGRAARQMDWRPALLLLAAVFAARRLLARGPAADAPIMITF